MTGMKAIALKNRLKAAASHPDYTFAIKNVRINGVTTGATGFITNERTGKHAYVSTDVGDYARMNLASIMYRTAESTRDFTGGRNRWVNESDDNFATSILEVTE